MKTVVVLSDSHGRCRGKLGNMEGLFSENSYIVHLGDGSADMRGVLSRYPEKTRVCRGNCDLSVGEEEFVLDVEGVRILCCHGHRYGVKSGRERLAARAKELNCTVALYGHTHTARVEEVEGVLCFNPGALGDYCEPSYGYLVLHGGRATTTVVPVPAE